VAVLEVAARTIGGRCSKAMILQDGSSLEELVILNALGRPYPTPALASACGVLMIPIPSSGTLTSVGGIDDVRSLREAEELLDVEIVAGVSGAGTAGGGEAGTAASTPVELGEARDTVS
jgi:hypothetical protein